MMYFLVPGVHKYLSKHGEVYTLRSPRRKKEGHEFFASSRRPFRPIGMGTVLHVKAFRGLNARQVARYAAKSGFKSGKDWVDQVAAYHKGRLPAVVHLYHAKLVGSGKRK